jgi:hypothetical protein
VHLEDRQCQDCSCEMPSMPCTATCSSRHRASITNQLACNWFLQFVVTLLTPFPNDSIRVLQAQLSAFVSPKVESLVRQAWRVAQTLVLLPADVRAVSVRSRVVSVCEMENMVKSQENRATS